jgi:hypothetical protein
MTVEKYRSRNNFSFTLKGEANVLGVRVYDLTQPTNYPEIYTRGEIILRTKFTVATGSIFTIGTSVSDKSTYQVSGSFINNGIIRINKDSVFKEITDDEGYTGNVSGTALIYGGSDYSTVINPTPATTGSRVWTGL